MRRNSFLTQERGYRLIDTWGRTKTQRTAIKVGILVIGLEENVMSIDELAQRFFDTPMDGTPAIKWDQGFSRYRLWSEPHCGLQSSHENRQWRQATISNHRWPCSLLGDVWPPYPIAVRHTLISGQAAALQSRGGSARPLQGSLSVTRWSCSGVSCSALCWRLQRQVMEVRTYLSPS